MDGSEERVGEREGAEGMDKDQYWELGVITRAEGPE